MATYTSNYGWTKPSGSDNVDISVLNNNLDDQDSTIHDAFLNMAPPFSESSTYAVDDIVLYGTGLYKCHTAVLTPGSWTGSTNWQVYKLSEGGSGGGGGTSNYNDLYNKPQINSVELSGNKTTSDLGILGETSSTAYRGDRGKIAYDHSQTTGNPHGTTAADVGLGNVPNVSTNDQEPTFSEASTRNNIASGEKLSVIMGKIQKFFNDLKTVAFSGSYTDLSDKPTIPTSASGMSYDNTDSGLSATDVQGAVDELDEAVDTLNSGVGKFGTKVAEITADGVKTYSQLFNELYPFRDRRNRLEIDGAQYYPYAATRFCVVGSTNAGDITLRSILLKETGSEYKTATIKTSTGAVSVNDISNGVPLVNVKIRLVRSFI